MIVFILSIPFYIKYTTRNKIYINVNFIESKEFAIVLGAGIKVNGTLGSYLRQRLDDIVTLYRNGKIKYKGYFVDGKGEVLIFNWNRKIYNITNFVNGSGN